MIRALSVLLALALAAPAAAQIPDEFSNLEVLPGDIGKRDLMDVMRNMTGALGVRCQYCHVPGENPDDLSGYDFASDENGHKNVARAMMRMVGEINGSLIPAAGMDSPTRVTCFTCHRGVQEPEPLQDILVEVQAEEGVDAARQRYRELREEYYGQAAYDFSTRSLNSAAETVSETDMDAAVALMEMNVEYHPDDAYAHLLLGRLYATADRTDEAIAAIERSLEIEPDNRWAQRILEQVRSGGRELMRILRVVLILAVLALVAIQFRTVDRTNPPVVSEVSAPPEVMEILRRSCYDCHSNETRWPWYSHVAPLSWRVAGHVEDGRGDLNFSDWPTVDLQEEIHLLEEIGEEVSEGEMPLRDYLWLHRDARLSGEDVRTLLAWANPGGPGGADDHDHE